MSSLAREELSAFLARVLPATDATSSVAGVLKAIAASCAEVSLALRTEVICSANGKNKFGDDVLSVDLLADDCISRHLQQCPHVAAFCSEERPTLTSVSSSSSKPVNESYCVAFDPLDGSSIIPCNFAVGSIFGIWRGNYFIGQKVSDIVSSVVVVYGPRTAMFLAHRAFGAAEFLLEKNGQWQKVSNEPLTIKPDAKIFAPGNLRSVSVLPWYRRIVKDYMDSGKTLRYTGGMVPDVCQILIKGNGVFMTPEAAPKYKVKLRVLFECGPMAFLIQCAGGYATTGLGDYMDLVIVELHQKSPIALGSKNDAKRFENACSNQQRTMGKL
ncbi:sedoheptulose-1,7-bisphosphatase, putative [Bodo saltans]|uniref:fructose-bisphosphatase n=1 Tax=Bodo saltans TaxID=75058 RepID=A0A0S4JL09_BODSA|nr:sedoheptulose-1,7-bisphosphatase, putative [Bodo saltans]|eukprot:CUG89701.1 sedoheptulose-1,7-bisphosphatase, putative [Bodo saltans]